MNNTFQAKIFWIIFSNSFRRQITIRYNKDFSRLTMRHAKNEYYRILDGSDIGQNNPKLIDILFTALVVSIYKSSDGKISPAKMGSIMTEAMESVSVFKRSTEKSNHFCKEWQDKRNTQSLKSKQKDFSDDFVSEFKYGSTYNEYGINYYECAIYKIVQREECPELAYQFCQFDYVMAKHMKAELKRSKTLVTGGDYCDFWYTKIV